jgi:hypothetical protein
MTTMLIKYINLQDPLFFNPAVYFEIKEIKKRNENYNPITYWKNLSQRRKQKETEKVQIK